MKKDQPTAAKGRSNSKSRSGQKPDALREQAERRLSKRSTSTQLQDAQKVLHELEVHQIELEMQNEALRQAEDTIIASREKYTDLYDFAPIGHFTFDSSGLITEVNLPGASLLGVERGQLKNKPFSLFVAAPSQDTFHRHYRGVLKTGTADTCELQLTRKDGTSLYVLVQSVPGRDAEGNLSGIRSAIGDITARKRADEALQLYELLARYSRDIILFIRPGDGRILEANAAATRAYGYTHEELLARSIHDLRAPGTQGLTADQKAEAERQGILFETVHRRKDGSIFPVEVASQGANIGATCTVISVTRDITERKQAEKTLREYEKVVESSEDMIAVVDRSYRYVLANNAFLNYRRLSRENVVGRSVAEVLGADVFESHIKKYLDACFQGETVQYEMKYSYPELGERDLLVSYFPIQGSRGVTEVASIMQDITERKQAEEALQKAHDDLELRVQERTAELSQAYEKLEAEMAERTKMEEKLIQSQKMEAIGILAGGIAHDFNNILAGMIGFSELAVDEVPADSKAQRHLKKVLEAGVRARKLVKQILAFSRKSEAERKRISLTPLVHETHALLRASLPATIRMPLAITASDDYVLADPTQIEQILMNLATNAAYAMRDEGGQLTIGISSVTFPPGSPLPDPDMEPGAYVKLTVKDTGTGMTEEVRQRIFDPFYTTKERGKGTGMGLAVVYGVVKGHGGAVTVQSEAGQGSTFEVFLPQVQKPEAKKGEETTSALPTGTERILFVDDEEMLVEMARNMLESLGYQVAVATNGTEAWNLFLKDPSRFDLVITDQTMPDMTGVTLALKMLRVRKEMPIILCTGYSEMVSADKAKEVGISEFVMKPVMKKELAETVRKVLDGRKE